MYIFTLLYTFVLEMSKIIITNTKFLIYPCEYQNNVLHSNVQFHF